MQQPKPRNILTRNLLSESILKILDDYEYYYVTTLNIDYYSEDSDLEESE